MSIYSFDPEKIMKWSEINNKRQNNIIIIIIIRPLIVNCEK
jgi:hypothetical protein